MFHSAWVQLQFYGKSTAQYIPLKTPLHLATKKKEAYLYSFNCLLCLDFNGVYWTTDKLFYSRNGKGITAMAIRFLYVVKQTEQTNKPKRKWWLANLRSFDSTIHWFDCLICIQPGHSCMSLASFYFHGWYFSLFLFIYFFYSWLLFCIFIFESV